MVSTSTRFFLAVSLGLGILLPALAEQTRLPDPAPAPSINGSVTEPETSPAATVKSESQPGAPPPSGQRHHTGLIAYTAGAIAEAPGAMWRQSAREMDAGVDALTFNSKSKLVRVPAAIISLPFWLFAGCVEGTIYAARYYESDNAPGNMKKSGSRE